MRSTLDLPARRPVWGLSMPDDAGLPWWSKVTAHIRAGRITYGALAARTGQSERTLRRWISRPRHADPSRGPAGELQFLHKIARATGLPVWYLVDENYGYPPPAHVLRLGAMVEAIPKERRELVMSLVTAEVADLLTVLVDRYGEVRSEWRQRWDHLAAEGGDG